MAGSDTEKVRIRSQRGARLGCWDGTRIRHATRERADHPDRLPSQVLRIPTSPTIPTIPTVPNAPVHRPHHPDQPNPPKRPPTIPTATRTPTVPTIPTVLGWDVGEDPDRPNRPKRTYRPKRTPWEARLVVTFFCLLVTCGVLVDLVSCDFFCLLVIFFVPFPHEGYQHPCAPIIFFGLKPQMLQNTVLAVIYILRVFCSKKREAPQRPISLCQASRSPTLLLVVEDFANQHSF